MKMIRACGAIVLGCSLAIACGGTVASVSDGGPGNDGSTGSDGSTGADGGASFCPPIAPGAGAACSPVGLECEYGSDPNPNCNKLMACTANGWVNMTPGVICPPPGSMCPASYQSVPVNQDCKPENLICEYPQGVCICTRSFGGPTRVTPGWDCFPTPPGCPSPRPHLGASCSSPGLDCNYGACSGGVDLVCKGGYWQQQQVPCPG